MRWLELCEMPEPSFERGELGLGSTVADEAASTTERGGQVAEARGWTDRRNVGTCSIGPLMHHNLQPATINGCSRNRGRAPLKG